MSPSLLPPRSECSVVARGYGPWDSAERELAYRLSDGMVMVWWWCGMVVYRSQDRNLALEWEWGGMCENGVKNLTNYYYELDMLIHRKPQLYRFLLTISNLHPISTKQCSQGWEWPVQIVLINFGTQVPLRSIALRSLTVEGFVPTLEFWRSYLQAVLDECYFWFRRCGDVIIYVIPHFMYSDIIVVWMWYSTRIWVIWFTTVILHFDSVDFPSWKSGRFIGHPICP